MSKSEVEAPYIMNVIKFSGVPVDTRILDKVMTNMGEGEYEIKVTKKDVN